MHTLKIGAYTIGRVAELQFPAFPAREFLPASTDEMVAEARRLLPGRIEADGKVVMSFHSFIVVIAPPGYFPVDLDHGQRGRKAQCQLDKNHARLPSLRVGRGSRRLVVDSQSARSTASSPRSNRKHDPCRNQARRPSVSG